MCESARAQGSSVVVQEVDDVICEFGRECRYGWSHDDLEGRGVASMDLDPNWYFRDPGPRGQIDGVAISTLFNTSKYINVLSAARPSDFVSSLGGHPQFVQ